VFTHEKFEAYKLSIEFTQLALSLVEELPPGHSALRDQLRRATFSIPLNIAEGTGKMGKRDRQRFYMIARGSAMECSAICDVVSLIDGRLAQRASGAKKRLESIVNILSKVCAA